MLARPCQEVALPFVVFSLTASTASTGVVQTAGMIAFLRFALFGGALVDRVDRRAAMIARGLSGAVLWGLFGLLLAVGLLAGSALSKRYAPKVGSGTLLVFAMSVDVEPRLSAGPAQLPGRGSPRSVDTARPPPYPFWVGTANLTGRSVSRGPSRGQCFCFIDGVGARARERSSVRSARRAD